MPPLNPFLAAFFKPGSSIAAQCTPVHHHVLLVPTTDFLLTSRETEGGLSLAEFVASDEFLGSHVLRIPNAPATAGGKDATGSLREIRGKAKQYNTLNGRSVVIKDAFVYSNKGMLLPGRISTITGNLPDSEAYRVQDPCPSATSRRLAVVFRYTRTSTMVVILHIAALGWRVG